MVDTVPLFHGNFYHIYNRGKNREDIFIEDQNYHDFLSNYQRYLNQGAELCAYCLLPNHFHLLIRVRDVNNEVQGISEVMQVLNISEQFGRLFEAYSQAFNKQYLRKGSLFAGPFQRKQVNARADLAMLVRYIHQNPEQHNLIGDFRNWQFSTYAFFIDASFSSLPRSEVYSWFGGRDAFVTAHSRWVDPWVIQNLVIE